MNLYNCSKPKIQNKLNIETFSKTLVKRIDMKAFGEPQVIHFGSGNKAGFTLVQLIETSNITGHFCDDTGDAYIDVFSCKDFCPKEVEKVVEEHFKPKAVQSCILERQAKPAYE